MVIRRLADIAEPPGWAPAYARNLWKLAQGGSTPSPEDEALALAQLDHPEFALLCERHAELPDDFTVEGMKPRLHVLLHQIVEKQLLEDNPSGARPAMAHLMELGLDRHAAIHVLSQGLVDDIYTALQHKTPTGYIPFLDRMQRARTGSSSTAQPKAGRNAPCPCGSGKKYKRCCGVEGPGPLIDPASASMILGDDGNYVGYRTEYFPPGHPLVTLNNLSAVARALERANANPLAGEAYQRLVDAAALVSEGDLNDALQEQMEFAMNHDAFATVGIEAARRLMELEINQTCQEMLMVDMADFYDVLGDSEQAESLYREALSRDPEDPYVYMRWARRLARLGRTAEATAAYQTVIDRADRIGFISAQREARRELAQLADQS
jgi:hypothetical protein